MAHSTVEDLIAKWDRNNEAMQERDRNSKEQGILKGRYLQFPWADGYAYYEIVRENKKSLRVKVITGIGDDWELPYLGEEATIDKEYGISIVNQRDAMAELFKRDQ